ncbi:MAG: hypothetical protein LBH34_05300 [Prevotellaceae bacterium]|jgi:hypothetical protein|nr:hypothetical protein [Prevotellaceae bacterium]
MSNNNEQPVVQDGQAPQSGQTIVINQVAYKSNSVGTAGFVLALIALVICWVPVAGWITWVLGLILSFVGVFKSPKGLAIAGLIISLIDVILLIAVVGIIAGFAGM